MHHGQTDWNIGMLKLGPKDHDLNLLGVLQAEKLASKFGKHSLKLDIQNTVIFSSQLQRASKTAQIISKCGGDLIIYFNKDLNERYFGDHSGQEAQDQETDVELHARMHKVINNILLHNHINPIIVSHHHIFQTLQKILIGRIVTVQAPGKPL